MGELYNPFPKLPKNIRQIGDRDDVVRLYVEDYVNTYLKRLFPTGGQDLRVGLLLGNAEQHDGMPYIFIDGALEMEDAVITGEKVSFPEAAWKKAYQSMEETFPKRTVQGWFLCGAPGCTLSPLNYYKQHGQYFGGKNQLMYLNGGLDGDESIYITSDDGFYRIKGYSVYYERNQMMQDYMILRKDARRVESGTNDRVIRDFKQRMEGRKKEAVVRRSAVRTLGMLCSALSVVVLAGGVVLFNNYTKMKEMETVLVSVLPSGVKGWKEYGVKDKEDDIIVEKITGSISAETTEAAGQQSGQAAAGQQDGQAIGQQDGQVAGQQSGQAIGQQSGQVAGQQSTGQPSGQAEGDDDGFSARQNVAGAAGATDAANAANTANAAAEALSHETAPVGENGGNSTAIRDFPVTNMKPGETYIVGEGETLYGICFKLYDSIRYIDDICALNQLEDVNKLMAGQELILPDLTGIQ